MSVASISDNTSLFNLLQSINAQSSSTTNNSSTTQNIAANSSTDDSDDSDDSVSSTNGGHHGHNHHGGGGLSSQLESSITSALQSAPAGSDPNTIIQQAIQNQLSGNTTQSSSGSSGNTTVSDSNAGSASESQAAFAQVLQQNGVDPQAFQQDLHSAIQNSQQNGQPVNFSQLFQNFPPGSTVDTTA